MDKTFSRRLRQLRSEKKISAVDMSLQMGMTKNYIYNIEHCIAYPSMTQFFGICQYLDISPADFMQFEPSTTPKQDELLTAVRGLSDKQMDILIDAAKVMQ